MTVVMMIMMTTTMLMITMTTMMMMMMMTPAALECEDCQTYSPCISPCPKKTCENRLTYNQQCRDVENTCFEGCDLQPCSPGQVYSSLQDPVTCIPETLCDTPACTINGKTYREGERIYDSEVCNHDCEIWFVTCGRR